MDARRPGRHTVSSTVPALRANKSPRHAADVFELSIASLQFFAWQPHTTSACPRLTLWRLLIVIDARWEFCPAFALVPGTTITTHTLSLLGQVMTNIARPRLWCLGSLLWQSPIVRRALRKSFLPAQPLHHNRSQSVTTQFTDRLRQTATLIPGYVDPKSQRSSSVIALARRCQTGAAAPREHFLSYETVMARLAACIQFTNTEPVTSPTGWGCWIPWERFGQQLKEYPPAKLSPRHRRYFPTAARPAYIHQLDIGTTCHLN